MAKNLVFLADGTGNDTDIKGTTNVYKLYQRLRNDVPGHQRIAPSAVEAHLNALAGKDIQVTQYDIGVGSSWFDVIGKATGKGISQNIKDGYEFFARFYEPGDRLYVFGFSRGAYTVRSLAGMIGICGLPRRNQPEGDLLFKSDVRASLVDEAYAIYKTQQGVEGRAERKRLGDSFIARRSYPEHVDPEKRAVYMIGVWDTVRSLGIPIGRGDIELPGNTHRFHDHDLSPYVSYAFHALSIDDCRLQFFPTIWNEPTQAEQMARQAGRPNPQVCEQVWFPGVHCDVGGGYPDDTGLADTTLKWMLGRIQSAAHPLRFYAAYETNPVLGLEPNPNGMLHDSRNTAFKKVLYQKLPRPVCRGFQESGQRSIAPAGDPAHIYGSWLDRFLAAFDQKIFEYDPENVRQHPDVTLARTQRGEGARPLPGPFSWFVSS